MHPQQHRRQRTPTTVDPTIVETIVTFLTEHCQWYIESSLRALEVEVVLGHLDHKTQIFHPGIDVAQFRTIVTTVNDAKNDEPASSRWSNYTHQKQLTVNYTDGVRFRLGADDAASYLKKTRLRSYVFSCNHRRCDFKVNISEERQLLSYRLSKDTQDVASVRLQERWMYTYDNEYHYHFSKVATGKTKDEAAATAVVFEAEIECDIQPTLTDRRITSQKVETLLQRAIDLCFRYDDKCLLVSSPIQLLPNKVY